MPRLSRSLSRVGILLLTGVALPACGASGVPKTAAVAAAGSRVGVVQPAVSVAPPEAPAPRQTAAPAVAPLARHFPFGPGSADMCRQDSAHANDDFGHGPGTPRREYDFVGVVDGLHYQLTWQLVPWHGAGTYRFSTDERTLTTWLYLMSLPDHTAYLALGGTVTVAPDGRSGTIDTSVIVADRRPAAIVGPWSCGDAE